jgi:hypothetical protein
MACFRGDFSPPILQLLLCDCGSIVSPLSQGVNTFRLDPDLGRIVYQICSTGIEGCFLFPLQDHQVVTGGLT